MFENILIISNRCREKSAVRKATKTLNKKCKERGKRRGEEQIYFVTVENFRELDGILRRIGLQCRLKPHASKAIERDFCLDRQ